MGLSVRQFVESLSSNSILTSAELSTLKGSLPADQQDTDAEPLVRQLVQQGKLTKFQAVNIYQGRTKGLTFGEYVVLDKIGAGGMGQVYKAQHRRMKRVVALKVLPPQAVNSPKLVQRFYQEVEVAAKLTHPNIVTAYDAGEQHGTHFLVMEFVDGQDLSSYVNKNGPLGVEQCINVVVQAARGLTYAHGLGIIHRDIKPGNLLIDRKGVVKVLDMGLARIDNPLADAGGGHDELTASGEVMGTVDYMAPEQAQDTRTADHRADIYALGCTIYRLLHGKPPFPGETTVQKILAHRDKPIPSLNEGRGDVPEVLDRLFKKMLAKNVAERTASMAQVVSSLENLLAGADDERSSIVIGHEAGGADEDQFNFLDRPSGSSNVALGTGASKIGGGGSGSGAGSTPSKLNPGKAAGQSAAASSGAIPRALPPSVSGTTPVGGAMPGGIGPPGSARGFPTVAKPAAGKTIAKAKRLENDTDAGGKTQAGSNNPAHAAALPKRFNLRDRRVQCALAGLVLVAAVGGYFVFRSPSNPRTEIAAKESNRDTSPAAATSEPATNDPAASATDGTVPQSVHNFLTGNSDSIFGVDPEATASGTAMLPPASTAPPPDNTTPPPEPMPAATAPPPVAIKPSGPLTAEVDLLATIEPEKTAHHSTWTREGSDIVCTTNAGPGPRVLVPFVPPEEYDLTCTVYGSLGGYWCGPGVVFNGKQAIVGFTSNQCGFGTIDGKPFYDGNNPTFFSQENIIESNKPATIVCAVRRDRVYVEIDKRPMLFYGGDAARISMDPAFELPPGQLFLYCNQAMRFQRLTIAPPTLKTPVVTTAVNLAARFDVNRDFVDGEILNSDGEILIKQMPGKTARLGFDVFRPESYAVEAVIERTAGDEFVCFGLPFLSRRIGAIVDWGPDKHAGLQHLAGNPAWSNITARRLGLTFEPGAWHVVRAEVTPDPKGTRVRLKIDGRQIIDYAGNDLTEGGESQVPNPRALSLLSYSSGWNIARFELAPVGGGAMPIPAVDSRAKAAESVRTLSAQAAAKGATAKTKLIAVNLLRREAATRLDDAAFRYAALDEALRIAADAGDLNAAYEAAEDLCAAFDVDRKAVRQRVVDVIKIPRPQADAKNQLTADALKLAERAARGEYFDYAADIATALDKFLGTSNLEAKREIKARTMEYALAITLQAAARDAEKTLAADPNDAAAHAALGRYLCFGVGDWPRGLKELSRGDDAPLKTAAEIELGDTSSADKQFDVGEQWITLSESAQPPLKYYYLEHAATWYRRAVPQLAAKQKGALDRRKTQLAQQRKASNGAGGPRRPLDAVKIGDHWYKYYSSSLPWPTAVNACERLGGNLLVLDNAGENQAIAQFLLQTAKLDRAGIWLGISDVVTEGQFVSVDGQIPTYTNWQPGQPDNGNGNEEYGALDVVFQSGAISTSWIDHAAGVYLPFICEWDH